MAVEVDALSQVPLLAGLERQELERLAGQFKEHMFPAGASITREGERARGSSPSSSSRRARRRSGSEG